jgi:molybdenum cofactor biosynthesis enzyme MoaA
MNNGKIKKFRNKTAYENWKKGMFANMNSHRSSQRKVAKAKNKSQSKKRIKHKGVGKVSSVKKKFCDTCKREGQSFEEGKCKICVEAFKEYKQPEKPKRTRSDIVGDKINDNWRSFVEEYWEWIKENKKDIPPFDEELDNSAYIFVPFEKSTLQVTDVQIDYPDFWRGTSSDNWVGQYPIDRDTTRQELLDADMSEETHYYEDPDYFGQAWDEEVDE